MIELVNEYNGEPVDFDCILYASIEDGHKGLLGNGVIIGEGIDGEISIAFVSGALAFAILTFGNKTISLYPFNILGTKITCRIDIPLSQVCKIKSRKYFIWNTLKLYFQEKGKIKLTVSNKTANIKKQKGNVEAFLQALDDYFFGGKNDIS